MSILTVGELREHVNTDLSDDALQVLLDAAEEQIVAQAGDPDTLTELAGGGQHFISLGRPAATITSIKELVATTETTLAADDYLLYPGGMLLQRLQYGTNPHSRWQGRVTVVYAPVGDSATRMSVQIDLCNLALTYQPGTAEEQIGDWREVFNTNNSAWNIATERDAILSRLNVSRGMVVV